MAKKKPLRRIVIGTTAYLWLVRRLDASYVMLRVWAAARNRRDFPLEVRLRYDDPWLNFGEIITATPEQRKAAFQLVPLTPALVRQIIDAAIRSGWNPLNPADHRRFEWDGVDQLVPVAHHNQQND